MLEKSGISEVVTIEAFPHQVKNTFDFPFTNIQLDETLANWLLEIIGPTFTIIATDWVCQSFEKANDKNSRALRTKSKI